MLYVLWFIAVDSAGCTWPNPEVSCSSAQDCSSIGVTDTQRECASGLACVDHICGLPPDALPADGSSSSQCQTDVQCSGGRPHCSPDHVCVACLQSSQCPLISPTCDAVTHSCRACASDSDCASTLCDLDAGTCFDESKVVYASSTGPSSGTCFSSNPCSIGQAFLVADPVRNTIKLAPGTYTGGITVASKTVNVRGVGATVSSASGNTFTANDTGRLRLYGLIVLNSSPTVGIQPVHCASLNNVDTPSIALDRTTVDSANTPMYVDKCIATIKRSSFYSRGGNSSFLASTNATVGIDRTLFDGGDGIDAVNGASIRITNSVIANQTGPDGAFVGAGGAVSVSFSTVINSTINSGNGTPTCVTVGTPDGVCIDNSVILNARVGAPTSTIAGTKCVANFTIVFPQATAVAGSNNKLGINPQLVDASNGDYHLRLGSPAIDAADPSAVNAIDFDGTARPQGAHDDMGAFEYKP